jgi:hypothetical protein
MEKERKTPNLIKVMKGLSFLWTIWNVFFHSFSLVFMFCWTTSKEDFTVLQPQALLYLKPSHSSQQQTFHIEDVVGK